MSERNNELYWDETYASKSERELSWYEAKPTTSLRFINEACPFP
jgi:hypothetical protein